MLAPGAAQQPTFAALVARLNETAVQLHQVYKGDLEAARLEIAQLRGNIAHEFNGGEDDQKGERGNFGSSKGDTVHTRSNLSHRMTSSDSEDSRFELYVSEDEFAYETWTDHLQTTGNQHRTTALTYPSLDEEANGEVASELFSSVDVEVLHEQEAHTIWTRQGTGIRGVRSIDTRGTETHGVSYGRHISFNELPTMSSDEEESEFDRGSSVGHYQTVKPLPSTRVFYSMRSPWTDQQMSTSSHKLTVMVESEREHFGQDPRISFRNPEKSGIEGSGSRCVLHPESRIRGFWVLACVGFLLYDIVMVPPEVCFSLEETFLSMFMDTAGLLFWTTDIVLSFFTGVQLLQHVEMRLSKIAQIYIRSWFLFDVAVVVPEWIGTIIDDDGNVTSQTSVFRVFRYGRFVRLLRMARILKFWKLKPLIRRLAYVLHLSKPYIQLTQAWITQSGLLLGYIHVVSCFWYGIGDALHDGWVHTNGFKAASASRSYVVSLHWTFSRLHGMNSGRMIESPIEMLLDALLIFLSLGIVAYYFGTVSALATRSANQIAYNLRKLAAVYARRHRISVKLNVKVMKFLECRSRYGGAGEQASEEQILLDALPKHLQSDLLFEARYPFFIVLPFFFDMYSYNPRILYQLCTFGVSERLLSDGELAFVYDDVCHSMLFVVSGKGKYISKATSIEMEELFMNTAEGGGGTGGFFTSSLSASMETIQIEGKNSVRVRDFSPVSEAVLWTRWTHAGSLVSVEECTALSLPTAILSKVTSEHRLSFSHACLYAKHFVWCLNHTDKVDDLTIFPELYIANLDNDIFHGKDHDHFVFISHYKVEAGTEASLMRGDWETILSQNFPSHPANDLRSPIFIDSEDLSDLRNLKEHVIHTNTLVLLLTPNVLSRPWCLIEIVTAMQNNLNIVPVEIQRPGSAYSYPTEQFYEDLKGGRYLPQAALDLLEKEDITLDDVENAIRQVFLKIALPFSPHKSKAVREAELQDIFKRCDKEWRSAYFEKHRRRAAENQAARETQAEKTRRASSSMSSGTSLSRFPT